MPGLDSDNNAGDVFLAISKLKKGIRKVLSLLGTGSSDLEISDLTLSCQTALLEHVKVAQAELQEKLKDAALASIPDDLIKLIFKLLAFLVPLSKSSLILASERVRCYPSSS